MLDNAEELERLSGLAEKLGVTAPVLIRIKPGVDAHTHSFVMTGQIDSKFGFALETGEAMAIVKKAVKTPNVRFRGLHCHIGSQIHQLLPCVETAKIMMNFMAEI